MAICNYMMIFAVISFGQINHFVRRTAMLRFLHPIILPTHSSSDCLNPDVVKAVTMQKLQ